MPSGTICSSLTTHTLSYSFTDYLSFDVGQRIVRAVVEEACD